LSTSSAVASPLRGIPWGIEKSSRIFGLRSITTKGRRAAENSSQTSRPMRPKPQTTRWSLRCASWISIRCLPKTVRISPVTTARMKAAAA
jgi:hypothetical protein